MNKKEILIQAISATPKMEIASTYNLSCEISSASLVCLLGERVSTLNSYMEVLAGINYPDTGAINFCNDLSTKNNYSTISYIYHNSALLSILNGIDNVKVPALYHHSGAVNEIDIEANILLDELKFKADHKVLPAFMNTLQKKQLLIVRAILLKPRILFIENPFKDLDREQVRIFGNYLAQLVKEKNITIVTSNVNLDFVQKHADQIIFFSSTDIHTFTQKEDFSSFILQSSI